MVEKFRKPFTYVPVQQHFDRKEIFITQKGQKINVYDMIQANREDTEILPTLRKYGNLKPLMVDHEALYGEFNELMRLEDIYAAQRKANEMWDNIPAELKEKFNNSQEEFIHNAPKWLEEKIKTISLAENGSKTEDLKTEGVDNAK